MKIKYLEKLYSVLKHDYRAAKGLYAKHPSVWAYEMLKKAQDMLDKFEDIEWRKEEGDDGV